MSEVTSSIEEPTVRVSQRLMRYRQFTLPHRMLWLTILAGMMVLAMGEGTANEFNGTTSESPAELSTVASSSLSPPREAVTDLFKAPLAAFKVQVPLSPQFAEGEEAELVGLTLGKAENSTDNAPPTPPFSNLWFNAGQSLGSAANSLTGWLNSRLVPQTTTTTTKPPEVIVRVHSHQVNRKPLITLDDKKKTQGNRIRPADDDEEADDDEDADDEEEDDDDEQNTNSNRYSIDDDDEDPEDDDDEEVDDDEEYVKPVKNRRGYNKKPNRKQLNQYRRGYDYDDDEEDVEDYSDDEDYDYDQPIYNSGRQQQQQQSLFNRFRQLAYGSSNKQQSAANQQKPGYRPVRIVQDGQVLQLVQDSNSNPQANRRRRPTNGQSSYELVPIRNNQGSNVGQQQQKKKRVNQPDPANEIVIPIPQSVSPLNGQKRPSQYITIPWSQLGIKNPPKNNAQSSQQAEPIIVNIPQHALQQNANRRRRPAQMSSQAIRTPQRKRLSRPGGNSPYVSVLTDQAIRDMFRAPEIPPSRTPQEEMGGKRKRPVKTNEMQSEDITTVKPVVNPEPETDADEDEDDNPDDPYIMVGDDDTEDEALARDIMPRRYMHIGGMKPYVDVLNKGRFYLKSGRQMRMDINERPESVITSINPELTVVANKDSIQSSTDIANGSDTESLSETKVNAPPTTE